jgi:hypothetical protein
MVPNLIKNEYTNNPYGSKNGLCYGISGNVKRVTKWNFIYGVEAGYEMLRSKVTINEISEHLTPYVLSSQYAATGKTNLNFSFINIQPFAGYRFMLRQVHVDITAGVDIGHCLKATEKGNAETENGRLYNTSVDRMTITTDIRPRAQVSAGYKRFGAYLGYSIGLKNYKDGYIGSTNESYSRILRFGVTYRLFYWKN